MNDNSLMPFGKYRGEKLGNIPASYLLYCYEKCWLECYNELKKYVEDNYQNLSLERERENWKER